MEMEKLKVEKLVHSTVKPLRLLGGGLKGKKKLQQCLFHWGRYDYIGSEHTLETLHYPMEVHVVHILNGYNASTVENVSERVALRCRKSCLLGTPSCGFLGAASWLQGQSEVAPSISMMNQISYPGGGFSPPKTSGTFVALIYHDIKKRKLKRADFIDYSSFPRKNVSA
ncbi:hypothetical protein NECAME_10104 [Necator americanus]|uniref:Alpha-carbonic anhydrase domain-containing protein n=1 Tax=Necator americanus TaxID=51031 RepID=W2TB54_NECAM|nr:hypothetical protein NECAME_10104 [Necator americanus]ETN78804.1 hypothetical protein NECAME_10104 [Necator americanus]